MALEILTNSLDQRLSAACRFREGTEKSFPCAGWHEKSSVDREQGQTVDQNFCQVLARVLGARA